MPCPYKRKIPRWASPDNVAECEHACLQKESVAYDIFRIAENKCDHSFRDVTLDLVSSLNGLLIIMN